LKSRGGAWRCGGGAWRCGGGAWRCRGVIQRCRGGDGGGILPPPSPPPWRSGILAAKFFVHKGAEVHVGRDPGATD